MKTRWIPERFARLVCAAGILLLASLRPTAAQTTTYWTAAGGDFNTASNWAENIVPGEPDHARFNTGLFHDVSLSAGVTNSQLTVGLSAAGDGTTVRLDLGGHTYQLTRDGAGTGASLIVGDTATGTLTVSNGTLTTEGFVLGRSPSGLTGRGTMIVTGSNTVWQSGNAEGRIGREGSDAMLRIENGAQATVGLLSIGEFTSAPTSAVLQVTGPGTRLTVAGTMTWGLRMPARVTIDDQAVFTAQSTSDIGINANADVTIDNARAIFEGSGGTNRQLNIRGLVTVENGGTLTATNLITRVRVRAGGVLVVGVEGGVQTTQIYFEDEDSTLRAVLHTGATNALVIASSAANQLQGVSLFEVELAPGFESDLEEKFTIISSGGWHSTHRAFKDLPEGATISAFESVSGKTYEFEVSYLDNNFTLTTIPEPGSLALLGLAGIGLWAARRRRPVP